MKPGAKFRNTIYSFYEKESRIFPWRENLDPWGILLSEFMLQQTQTARVTEYWKRWMKKWPGPADVYKAGLDEVLREWNGLGYNRRGKYVKDCAAIITLDYKGLVPENPEALAALPGIGPYTAGAIACFAYNYPSIFIETNIRSVMLHFFFEDQDKVTDRELIPFIRETLDRENPRKWYWALMDYGAALKKQGNPSRRSAHYARQSRFEGSFRQLRGNIIRSLTKDGPGPVDELQRRIKSLSGETDFYRALESLKKEYLVSEEGGIYRICD